MLQHARAARHFGNADAELLRNVALRNACSEQLHLLPTLGERSQFTGREEIVQQIARLLARLDGAEEIVEIGEGIGLGHEG